MLVLLECSVCTVHVLAVCCYGPGQATQITHCIVTYVLGPLLGHMDGTDDHMDF